jgi:hypothetical protein
MTDKISMADLLARNLAIDWFEAVSLVREVCAVLISERVEDSTPDLAQILLAATGKITITGTAHGDAPVRRLGQLLQALLRTTDPPVTLRLVLSEAMAAPPVYASVADLDAALAYFERPDRRAVLQGVYERAAIAQAEAPLVREVQDLDAIAPLPVANKTETKKHKPADRRAVVFVTCGIVLVMAAMFAYNRGIVIRDGSLKVVGEGASAAVDKAVVATMSAVSEMAGMGKLVTAGTPAEAEISVPPAPAGSTPVKRSTHTAPIGLAGMQVKLFDLQPAPAVRPAVDVSSATAGPVLATAAAPTRVVDINVYGPENHDVEPPLAIRPHLPTALPTGVTAAQLARIEIVVGLDGLVDAVKLVPGTRPVSVTEAMLLSAAKAWRFSPAVKDGNPVKYRKTVFLSEK